MVNKPDTPCSGCGTLLYRGRGSLPNPTCRPCRRAGNGPAHQHLILRLGSKKILLGYLIKRDKGRCQIPRCLFRSRRVAPLGSKGPRKPSIDHIIPLDRGGTHELSNVQLAHFGCNLSKGNRGGGEQLLLIG